MNKMNEELVSYTENELMGKERMRRAVLAEGQKARAPKRFKALLPIAACLAAICLITVFAVPSARAEVLKWFGIVDNPAEYLNKAPGERIPVAALDELIVQPAESGSEAGSITNNRVISVADEPIWQSIADDFSIELGETIVDGESMYLALKLHGLAALPTLDDIIGGNATRSIIPADYLPEIYPDGVPEEYADGSANYWESAQTFFMLILEDGTPIRCLEINDKETLNEIIDLKIAEFGRDNDFAGHDETQAQLSQLCMEWLDGRTVPMTVACELDGLEYQGRLVDDPVEFLSRYADENGVVRAKVVYSALNYYPEREVKLEAELGEACFDVKRYLELDKRSLTAEVSEIVLGERETVLSCGSRNDANGEYTVTNVTADLAGVKLTPAEAYIDALGVHGVAFTVTFPEDWTDEMCRAFVFGLDFKAEVDGEEQTISGFGREKTGEREYRIAFRMLHLPYDSIKSVKTLTITPELTCCAALWKTENTRKQLPLGKTVVIPETYAYIELSPAFELADAVMVFTAGE